MRSIELNFGFSHAILNKPSFFVMFPNIEHSFLDYYIETDYIETDLKM